MRADQAVFIHYHIFKNAGTSVDFALQQLFQSQWTTYEGTHAHDVLSSQDLEQFLEKSPNIKAVSTHLARPPLPYEGACPIVFLRHPIARAKSVFEFVRRDPNQPNHPIVSRYSFQQYIEAVLDNKIHGGVVINNYQTIHLSDASFRDDSILKAKAIESDLEQAKKLLSIWPAFGIVDRYEDSMALLNSVYRKQLNGQTLPMSWLNKSREHTSIQDIQLDKIRHLLGAELYRELCNANNFDSELYYWGLERFLDSYKAHIGNID